MTENNSLLIGEETVVTESNNEIRESPPDLGAEYVRSRIAVKALNSYFARYMPRLRKNMIEKIRSDIDYWKCEHYTA